MVTHFVTYPFYIYKDFTDEDPSKQRKIDVVEDRGHKTDDRIVYMELGNENMDRMADTFGYSKRFYIRRIRQTLRGYQGINDGWVALLLENDLDEDEKNQLKEEAIEYIKSLKDKRKQNELV